MSAAATDLCKVLLVDDEEGIVKALRRLLLEDYIVLSAVSGGEALALLARNPDVACIISDQRMPEMGGAEFLAKSREVVPDAQRIVLTGYTDMEDVVRMINEGKVHYYLTKPWEGADLKLVVRRATETWMLARENRRLVEELRQAHSRLQEENVKLRSEVEGRYSFEGIVGTSAVMRNTLELLQKVLVTDTSVLLLGETGVGKGILARAVHYAGARKEKSFVAQNCAALPETLLVSELFGHTKGSFTGAIRDKKGLFEQADGGTIFLDEIGETSPGFQQQLLRVLQEGEIWPVGAERPVHVDVRVIAATNRNLEEEVKKGNFREDLYYRLAVFPIEVPPLRERAEDIPLLVEHFLAQFCQRMNRRPSPLDPEALDQLLLYAWPGNVRELENEIERALVLAPDGGNITNEVLSPKITGRQVRAPLSGSNGGVNVSPRTVTNPESARQMLAGLAIDTGKDIKAEVEELERVLILEALAKCDGNKAQVARLLGLSRMGLDKKLSRYGIEAGRGRRHAE